jgi:hypothetical protein
MPCVGKGTNVCHSADTEAPQINRGVYGRYGYGDKLPLDGPSARLYHYGGTIKINYTLYIHISDKNVSPSQSHLNALTC